MRPDATFTGIIKRYPGVPLELRTVNEKGEHVCPCPCGCRKVENAFNGEKRWRANKDDGIVVTKLSPQARCVPCRSHSPIKVRAFAEPEHTERMRILSSSASRDPSWRARVLARWGTTCSVPWCDYDLHVEAAHIVAVEDGGSDHSDNGMPLCGNHHWEFDNLGGFSGEDK